MKIYLDLVLFLNFFFDLLLLLGVAIVLRRNVPLFKLLIGAFIGSLSIFLLFIKINSFELFILKVFISIVMLLISFGYKNIGYLLKNMLFLYSISMLLGGVMYYINNEFAYKRIGLVFFHNGLSINIIFLVIFSPLTIYVYVKECIKLKNHYHSYYPITIKVGKKNVRCSAYLDTGNKLVDPYTFKPIILYYTNDMALFSRRHFLYVPYHTISGNDMIKCFKVDEVLIENIGVRKNVLVGILNEKIRIDGIDCILNVKLLEG